MEGEGLSQFDRDIAAATQRHLHTDTRQLVRYATTSDLQFE